MVDPWLKYLAHMKLRGDKIFRFEGTYLLDSDVLDSDYEEYMVDTSSQCYHMSYEECYCDELNDWDMETWYVHEQHDINLDWDRNQIIDHWYRVMSHSKNWEIVFESPLDLILDGIGDSYRALLPGARPKVEVIP